VWFAGVQVIVACRNSAKTEAAVHELRLTKCEDDKAAEVEQVELNLASLSSVERCAEHVINKGLPINLLINNAGMCVRRNSLRACLWPLPLSGRRNSSPASGSQPFEKFRVRSQASEMRNAGVFGRVKIEY
jgi:NAD(P)-dependent dehydrogenase (short-subunit alcohol dehydrogenase family)